MMVLEDKWGAPIGIVAEDGTVDARPEQEPGEHVASVEVAS